MDLKREQFFLVDKILYKASGRENEIFGEYELDYVYLCKLKSQSVSFKLVPEEVCEVEWVKKENVREFVEKKQKIEKCYFSPWFMKMFNNGLIDKWWQMAVKNELKNAGTEETLGVTSL